jgi:hypothetical protein
LIHANKIPRPRPIKPTHLLSNYQINEFLYKTKSFLIAWRIPVVSFVAGIALTVGSIFLPVFGPGSQSVKEVTEVRSWSVGMR